MYNFMPIIVGVVLFCLGLFMATNPKQATKKELQNNEVEVAKIKRNGFILIICAIVILLIGIISLFLLK